MLPESENISVEFKSAQVRPESVAREMVAFSNSYGGTGMVHYDISPVEGSSITDDVVQKKELAGPLTDQIDAAVSFMRLFTPEPLVVKDSPRRENTLAIPLDVLRETVVNAVAHRDYSILTRKIHIYIYTDRIEVQSPGRLANTLSQEMLPYGNSAL